MKGSWSNCERLEQKNCSGTSETEEYNSGRIKVKDESKANKQQDYKWDSMGQTSVDTRARVVYSWRVTGLQIG